MPCASARARKDRADEDAWLGRHDKKRVLIADDEPDLGELLAFEFCNRGFDAEAVLDGRKALEALTARPVDALVTDIRMPSLDGIELTRRLKTRNPFTPAVILISAYADVPPVEAYAAGAEGYFSKPFRLDDLTYEVERILRPPDKRWSGVSLAAPAHTIEGVVAGAGEGAAAGLAAFGRGGIALHITDLLFFPGQEIKLDLHLDSGPFTNIEGHGVVRWTVPEPDEERAQYCGIEILRLSDETRPDYVRWVEKTRPVAYIPDLRRA